MKSIILKFHTVEWECERALVAQAIEVSTERPLASLSLSMMAQWLKKNGYSWDVGTNGIWSKAA